MSRLQDLLGAGVNKLHRLLCGGGGAKISLEARTLKQLEDTLRLSDPVWYRGGTVAGGGLPLVFTISDGPTFFGLNFDEFFDPSTGLIRESALPALGSTLHEDLTDITANQHHTSFLQADADLLYEALGDIAIHAAITGAHHAEYTDADAIAAVEGEATLALSGAVDITGILTVDIINERTLDAGLTIGGDIQVNGNDIKDSEGIERLTLGATNIFGGHIQMPVNGEIQDSGGVARMSVMSGETVINQSGADINLRVEGTTSPRLLNIDAGLNAVRIGTTVAGRIAEFFPTAIVFNEGGADMDIRFEGFNGALGPDPNLFRCNAGNNTVGIGNDPLAKGKLSVDQNSATRAIPVLALDQADIDDVFVNFIGISAADGTRSISSDTGEAGACFGKARIEINGVMRWIRFYEDST